MVFEHMVVAFAYGYIVDNFPCHFNTLALLSVHVHRSSESGALFIDSSTTDPQTSIDMSKEAEKLGVTFLDAPVSGHYT